MDCNFEEGTVITVNIKKGESLKAGKGAKEWKERREGGGQE